MNALALLILEHLAKAAGNMVPDGTLYIELKAMTRPVATEIDWKKAIRFLTAKGLIGTERDPVTDEVKHLILEKGEAFLVKRRRA
jgi:hypothetical protein